MKGREVPGDLVVKDLALSLLCCSFNPWPGNPTCCGHSQKKKKKKEGKKKKSNERETLQPKIVYPVRYSFKFDKEVKRFKDKQN